jgi:hypothetical protein
LADENVTNGVWSANLTAATTGTSTVTLTVTFQSSNVVRKRKFQVTVT